MSLNGASDFSSSTKRWKTNSDFSVSTDVFNGLCFSYPHEQLKLPPSPSVVSLFKSDCIFPPLTLMVLVVDLIVSALREFSVYDTVINLTRAFCAVDNTCTSVCFRRFPLWIFLEGRASYDDHSRAVFHKFRPNAQS